MDSLYEFISLFSIVIAIFAYKAISKRKSSQGDSSSSTTTLNKNSNTANNVETRPADFHIYYGSQSGTSESFAFQLEKKAQSFHLHSKVHDLSDFNPEQFVSSEYVIILIATYGDGDPTDSSIEFFDWLSSLQKNSQKTQSVLNLTKFAVFGLGNSSYEHYNAMGKKVQKLLIENGATPICKLALGDDNEDIEEDFKRWEKDIFSHLQKYFSFKVQPAKALLMNEFVLKYKCVYHENNDSQSRLVSANVKIENFVAVPIAKNEIISKDKYKWHMELDISSAPDIIKNYSGGNIHIAPKNSTKLVDQICKRLKVNKNSLFHLERIGEGDEKEMEIFSSPMTINNALLWHVDLTHKPHKSFLDLLNHMQSDTNSQQSSQDSSQDNTNNTPIIPTILNLLTNTYTEIPLKLEHLLQFLPRLSAREYTISSSPLAHPNTISLTYSRITPNPSADSYGVCTTYLSSLSPQNHLFVRAITPSLLNLPSDLNINLLMIATGSGIAPFRAFIQQANHRKSQGHKIGRWALIYGCKTEQNDFLYQKEITDALNNNEKCLSQVFMAFSRRDPSRKIYVQDIIKANSATLKNFLDSPSSRVYICGSTLMGKSVKQSLLYIVQREIFSDNTESGKIRAQAFLSKMHSEKRLVSELWG